MLEEFAVWWSWDLWIAVGLVVAAIVVALLSQLNLLPKRSMLFVGAALLGAFGFSIFKRMQADALVKKLDETRKQLEQRERLLAQMRDQVGVSQTELDSALAELELAKRAYEDELALIEQGRKSRHDRAGALSGSELDDEFERGRAQYRREGSE